MKRSYMLSLALVLGLSVLWTPALSRVIIDDEIDAVDSQVVIQALLERVDRLEHQVQTLQNAIVDFEKPRPSAAASITISKSSSTAQYPTAASKHISKEDDPMDVVRNMSILSVNADSALPLSVRVPLVVKSRASPIINLVAICTQSHVNVYSLTGTQLCSYTLPEVEEPSETSRPSLSVFGAISGENLLAVTRPDSSVVVLQLSAWRKVKPVEEQEPWEEERAALELEGTIVGDRNTKISALAMHNKRYLKLFIVGYDNGWIHVFTRNGTLKYMFATGDKRVLSLSQTRARHVTFATEDGIGFFKLSQAHRVELECLFDKEGKHEEVITSLVHDPKRTSTLYAGTSLGRLLVFDLEQYRYQANSCGLMFSLNPSNMPIWISVIPGYVIAADPESLHIYNTTGRPLSRPRLSIRQEMPKHESEHAQHSFAKVSAVMDVYDKTTLIWWFGDQVHVLDATLYQALEKSSMNLGMVRAPVFLVGMVVMVLWQMRRKRSQDLGGDMGMEELSAEDQRMLQKIMAEQSTFELEKKKMSQRKFDFEESTQEMNKDGRSRTRFFERERDRGIGVGNFENTASLKYDNESEEDVSEEGYQPSPERRPMFRKDQGIRRRFRHPGGQKSLNKLFQMDKPDSSGEA